MLARNWRSRNGRARPRARPGPAGRVLRGQGPGDDRLRVAVRSGGAAKQARIRKLGRSGWRRRGGAGRQLRFDVAAVLSGKVEVLEAAF